MHEFTIDGTRFVLTRALKVKQALKAEALLIEVFLPAFAAFGNAGAGIDPAALAGLERLDELVDMFAGICKADRSPEKGGAHVDLKPFLDEIFERRNAVLLAWLAACVEWQFSDFFGAAGQAILQEAANRFDSLTALIGGSGDSSPTSESPKG